MGGVMSEGASLISSVVSPPVPEQVGGARAREAVPGGLNDAQLLDIYRSMYTIRRFEVTMERAHLAGDLYGPFHSSMGQEAIPAGGVRGPADRGCGHVDAPRTRTRDRQGCGPGSDLCRVVGTGDRLLRREGWIDAHRQHRPRVHRPESDYRGERPPRHRRRSQFRPEGGVTGGGGLPGGRRGRARESSTRPSIWPPSGVCRWCSWWRTTDTHTPSGRTRCS